MHYVIMVPHFFYLQRQRIKQIIKMKRTRRRRRRVTRRLRNRRKMKDKDCLVTSPSGYRRRGKMLISLMTSLLKLCGTKRRTNGLIWMQMRR